MRWNRNQVSALSCTLALALGFGSTACGEDGNEGTGGGAGGATGGTDGGNTGGSDAGGTGGASGGTGGASGGTGAMGGLGGTDGGLGAITEVFADSIDLGDDDYVEDFQGVDITSDGLIYVAGGTVDPSDDDDDVIAVARFDAQGNLDTDFGEGAGYILLNAVEDGDEDTTAIAALPDGGAAIAINAADSEGQRVLVARIDDTGALVGEFGDSGYEEVEFTDYTASGEDWGNNGGVGTPDDLVYDLDLDESGSEDRLVLFGQGPAPISSGRTDIDRYIARIDVDDGALDATFGTNGIFTTDFGKGIAEVDQAKRGQVLDDGSVVSAGYTEFPDDLHHIFLIHLGSDGAPVSDTEYYDSASECGTAQEGVVCSNPFIGTGYAEAYGVVVQANGNFVTTGYGEETDGQAEEQDVVSFRFTQDSMDSSYGTAGALVIDSGSEDRGRDAVILPDGRIVHVGLYGGEAAIYVTDEDGAFWTDFGTDGIQTYPSHTGNLRGVAQRDGLLVAVGDASQGEAGTGDDRHGYLVIHEVE